jgi:hypothetical protein
VSNTLTDSNLHHWTESFAPNLGQALQAARERLTRTQKETQEAFSRYTSCLEAERHARQEVAATEQHREDLSECYILPRFLFLGT